MGKRIRKRAPGGTRHASDLIATVMYYGPDDRVATKVAVGIVGDEATGVIDLKRWFSDGGDIREQEFLKAEILAFVAMHGARRIVYSDGIIGCPHEEGIDYPLGQSCPQCPFWADRD
jgi:hypothetical protein